MSPLSKRPETASASSETSSLLLRGAAWIGGARILIAGIGFASTLILARLLLPADFGLVAIATTSMMMVSVLSELSLSNALVQLDDLEDDHYHTAFTLELIRGLILAGAVALLAHPIAGFFDDERLAPILLALAATSVFGSLSNARLVDFKRALRFGPSMFIASAGKVVGFVVGVAIAYVTRSYWALVLGSIAAQLTQVALGYVLIAYRPRLSLSRTGELLDFSIWLTFANWIQTFNWRSDPLVLGYFVPVGPLGQYHISNRITNMLTQEVSNPIAMVLFPAFSRMKHEPRRLRAAYLKAVSILTSVAMPIAIGITVTADLFVPVVIGEKWMPAVPYFQILGITAALKSVQHVNPIAMATGHTKGLFRREVRAFCIRAPLLFGGIYVGMQSSLGILMGALLGRLVAVIFNTVWNMTLIAEISKIRVRDQAFAAWRAVFAVLVMAAVVTIWRKLDWIQSIDRWMELMLVILLGGISYFTCLYISWRLSGRPDGVESIAYSLMKTLVR